jgi:cobalamin biosynthesis protein CbiD
MKAYLMTIKFQESTTQVVVYGNVVGDAIKKTVKNFPHHTILEGHVIKVIP